MKEVAQKISEITGGDPEIIQTILEEGFGVLTQVTNDEVTKCTGIKVGTPLLSNQANMVYSVLASVEKVIRDVFPETNAQAMVMLGFESWKTKRRPLSDLTDDEIMSAMSDPDFDGIYSKERKLQNNISDLWLLSTLANIALSRELITEEIYNNILENYNGTVS